MANITERISAAQWRADMVSPQSPLPGRVRGAGAPGGGAARPARKYRNQPVMLGEERFDSTKELRHFQALQLAMKASCPQERVTSVDRQRRFILVPPQQGERAVTYLADFVVEFADGRQEVHDVKSSATRKEPRYVIKRKLMLSVHGVRIKEV